MIATPVLLTLGAVGANPFEAEISAAVENVGAVWPVPAALVQAVIRQESAFHPRARSTAGAIGLMQLMPANAAKLGFTEAELWEPAKNVLAGTRFLAVLLKHYDGDLISALVAYNAHPMKLGAPIPRNGETPAYVARVLRFYARYSNDSPALGGRSRSRAGPTEFAYERAQTAARMHL
jgi:soluble lytic murein transglycosylase-like protein